MTQRYSENIMVTIGSFKRSWLAFVKEVQSAVRNRG